MQSTQFEDLILLVISTPVGRIFFSKKSCLLNLHPCIDIKPIIQDNTYILFYGSLPDEETSGYKLSNCKVNSCRYCKGYGLVEPRLRYSSVYSLGLEAFRSIPKQWDEICIESKLSETLFIILTSIYSLSSTDICLDCDMIEECVLSRVRRQCIPIKFNKDDLVDSPYFEPPARSGLYPLMFINSRTLLCNFSTISKQGNGIVQSGMRNRPKFYVAKYKQNISKIKIPKVLQELCYQYAMARRYRIKTINIKPFIVTVDIHEQVHFGKDFVFIKDNLEYLCRTRPLLRLPFIGKLSDKTFFRNASEVLFWQLEYRSVENFKSNLSVQIALGLVRLFGIGMSYTSGEFMFNNESNIFFEKP